MFFVFTATTFACCGPTPPDCDGDECGNISVTETCITSVIQSNKTVANTIIVADSNTGGNTVCGGTCGASSIVTGDATTLASVKVMGGENYAEVPSCCECPDCTPCDITQLCEGSDANININNLNMTSVSQKSETLANTSINAGSNTGSNKVFKSTRGFNWIKTGEAITSVKVKVFGGSNLLY